MDQSQSLNVPPFFDGNNYAFWKVQMRAFLYSIDDTIWDSVETGWTRPKAAKSTRDKAALAVEAWEILETTYEGTKKVKDTKLQMLTTRFEELKMSEDKSFDSFYS